MFPIIHTDRHDIFMNAKGSLPSEMITSSAKKLHLNQRKFEIDMQNSAKNNG